MKYFIVTDIHGFYTEMITALQEAGFDKDNPEHCFVSLGDLLDRGSKPEECLDFVNSLDENRKILIRGNHEDLLDEAIERKFFHSVDFTNGTAGTVFQLTKEIHEDKALFLMTKNLSYQKYKKCLVDYAEIDDMIFVHGWIPNEPNWREGNWNKARWTNGMEAYQNGTVVPNKTIFCGHWHTSWGHHYIEKDGMEFPNKYSTNPEHRRANFKPFVHEGIVALDACTAFTHSVNCYVVERNNI